MDRDAQLVWAHVLREMRGTGVIVGADRDLLRVYAETMASYTRNRALLVQSGSVIVGARSGDVVVNPLSRVVRGESDMLRLLARELGLSPAARAGLRIDLGADQGDMDDILGPAPRLRVVGGDDEE
jgi:P27 family predicted phage terminase small subunit